MSSRLNGRNKRRKASNRDDNGKQKFDLYSESQAKNEYENAPTNEPNNKKTTTCKQCSFIAMHCAPAATDPVTPVNGLTAS